METKKNILIFINHFLPGYKAGGPTQSVANLSQILKERFNVYIVCLNRDAGETSPYEGVVSDKWIYNNELGLNIYYLSDEEKKVKSYQTILSSIKIDFLYLNSLWDYYFSILPLVLTVWNKYNCKIILAPRGELNPGALAIKSFKKKIFKGVFKLSGFHRKVVWNATNEIESELIVKHFGDKIDVRIVSNVPKQTQSEWEVKQKEKGKARFIFISRIAKMKNLLFLIKVIKELKMDLLLDIYGPIEDKEYWKECRIMIGDDERITYKSEVPQPEIAKLLTKYHFFILPTKGENFGHSIFESFLAGIPVLISDRTPWLNLEKSNIGWDTELNPTSWELVIRKAIEMGTNEYQRMSKDTWLYGKEYNAVVKKQKKIFSLFLGNN